MTVKGPHRRRYDRDRYAHLVVLHKKQDFSQARGVVGLGMKNVRPIVYHEGQPNQELLVEGEMPNGEIVCISRAEALSAHFGENTLSRFHGPAVWLPTPQEIKQMTAELRKLWINGKAGTGPMNIMSQKDQLVY